MEVLDLQDLVKEVPEELRDSNFERLYGNLHAQNPNSQILIQIKQICLLQVFKNFVAKTK